MVALLLTKAGNYVINIGDSRCYALFENGLFKQLTEEFGKTVIVVTHSNAVSKFSDLRLKLENGQLRLMGENE